VNHIFWIKIKSAILMLANNLDSGFNLLSDSPIENLVVSMKLGWLEKKIILKVIHEKRIPHLLHLFSRLVREGII